MSKDPIDKLFRDKLGNRQFEYDESYWLEAQEGLKTGGKPLIGKGGWISLSVVATIATIAVLYVSQIKSTNNSHVAENELTTSPSDNVQTGSQDSESFLADTDNENTPGHNIPGIKENSVAATPASIDIKDNEIPNDPTQTGDYSHSGSHVNIHGLAENNITGNPEISNSSFEETDASPNNTFEDKESATGSDNASNDESKIGVQESSGQANAPGEGNQASSSGNEPNMETNSEMESETGAFVADNEEEEDTDEAPSGATTDSPVLASEDHSPEETASIPSPEQTKSRASVRLGVSVFGEAKWNDNQFKTAGGAEPAQANERTNAVQGLLSVQSGLQAHLYMNQLGFNTGIEKGSYRSQTSYDFSIRNVTYKTRDSVVYDSFLNSRDSVWVKFVDTTFSYVYDSSITMTVNEQEHSKNGVILLRYYEIPFEFSYGFTLNDATELRVSTGVSLGILNAVAGYDLSVENGRHMVPLSLDQYKNRFYNARFGIGCYREIVPSLSMYGEFNFRRNIWALREDPSYTQQMNSFALRFGVNYRFGSKPRK